MKRRKHQFIQKISTTKNTPKIKFDSLPGSEGISKTMSWREWGNASIKQEHIDYRYFCKQMSVWIDESVNSEEFLKDEIEEYSASIVMKEDSE